MSNVIFDFSGDNFVITGASSGIGREITKKLASAGATVLAIARRKDKLEELSIFNAKRIIPAVADVCDHDAMIGAISAFVATYGKLSGSVHAAGLRAITPMKSFNVAQAHLIMDISFWAGVDFLQVVTKKRTSLDGASHILFSSVYSTYAAKGMFAYNAAKSAVVSAIKTAAKEFAPRQRVNAVMPGWVQSEMTDELRKTSNIDEILSHELLGEGKPSDVAEVVLFLLSSSARWITGTSIAVDGGFLA